MLIIALQQYLRNEIKFYKLKFSDLRASVLIYYSKLTDFLQVKHNNSTSKRNQIRYYKYE